MIARATLFGAALVALLAASGPSAAQKKKDDVPFPPTLPDKKEVVTDTSEDFLKRPTSLRKDVAVAKAAPTIDFLYYPGQTYAGKPWSAWGESLAANGKYYASVGDHLAPEGNAFVYEYDPKKKTFRQLVDLRKLLNLPAGDYSPGKIHGRLDLGDDGGLYFSTHRGSPRVTNDQYRYKGDWIVRHDLKSGKNEVVVHGPVPKHCIPASVVDPKRLIFYGATAAGDKAEGEGIHFFAYDLKNKKMLCDVADGPSRCILLARSTGKVYYAPGKGGPLMRWDPAKGGDPVKLDLTIGARAASQETPKGMIYTVSQGQKAESILYAFDTKSEKAETLGPAAVGTQQYVASLAADPTGRYLYYVPGAHGHSEADGSPLVQYDTKAKSRKVIAFLDPYYQKKYGCTPRGTYSVAVDTTGERVYVTWNVSRGTKAWDCTALSVIHVPASERKGE